MTDSPRDRIGQTYRRMASEARYRPKAPGDGLGNIYMPHAELDLDQEISEYASQWEADERRLDFTIGVTNYSTLPATIFAVEAARCLCAVNDDVALKLLKMAVAELEREGASAPPWRT